MRQQSEEQGFIISDFNVLKLDLFFQALVIIETRHSNVVHNAIRGDITFFGKRKFSAGNLLCDKDVIERVLHQIRRTK